jgi:hypothetical protein
MTTTTLILAALAALGWGLAIGFWLGSSQATDTEFEDF